jgi:hypothetical protein
LASGFTILSGFVICLFVMMAFSDSQARGIAFVVILFGVIILIPISALRGPRDPRAKGRRWWMFWRRRKRKQDAEARHWKRRRGQEKHRPFGHRDVAPAPTAPSTFVAAPRKPTEP